MFTHARLAIGRTARVGGGIAGSSATASRRRSAGGTGLARVVANADPSVTNRFSAGAVAGCSTFDADVPAANRSCVWTLIAGATLMALAIIAGMLAGRADTFTIRAEEKIDTAGVAILIRVRDAVGRLLNALLADAAVDRCAGNALAVPIAHFQTIAEDAIVTGHAGNDGPARSLVVS